MSKQKQYKTYDEMIADLYEQKNSEDTKVAEKATDTLNELFSAFVKSMGTQTSLYTAVKAWAKAGMRYITRDEKVVFT